ncbi:unnamed protein product [Caretta caretta]
MKEKGMGGLAKSRPGSPLPPPFSQTAALWELGSPPASASPPARPGKDCAQKYREAGRGARLGVGLSKERVSARAGNKGRIGLVSAEARWSSSLGNTTQKPPLKKYSSDHL